MTTSHVLDEVARAGIFTPEALAPPAGTYHLTMTYEGAARVVFDCGTIVIGDEPSDEGDAEVADALSFLKEQQWKLDFRLAGCVVRFGHGDGGAGVSSGRGASG